MGDKKTELRPLMGFSFEIDLPDKVWAELGYDAEHLTTADVFKLMMKMREFQDELDFMPLLRHAARSLGKQVQTNNNEKGSMSDV